MDLYISDSMQDMLDIDIKSEVATVVGGVNEFSSLMNFDLPSLELDTNSNDAESGWCGGGPTRWSSSDIYADVGACVNPNSVMPVISSTAQSLLKSPKQNVNLNTTVSPLNDPTLPSPKERKSHLTFSPHTIKVPVVVPEAKKPSLLTTGLTQIQRVNAAEQVKKDLSNQLQKNEANKIIVRNHSQPTNGPSSPSLGVGLGKGNTIKLAAGIGGLTFANGVQFKNLKHVQKITSIAGANNLTGLKRPSSPAGNGNGTTIPTIQPGQTQLISLNGTTQKVFSRSIIVQNGSKPSNVMQIANGNIITTTTQKAKPKPVGNEFPKPAYSYSCLIAMALKNSRSGSLPVSEIYSFMCEHFPYFKTAPNGWKNSVRHNLSLNKCFEKIEKPVTNGGQRKGCLWAMNPAKITKMDEEVQKWSRKDPMAIRKAMVHPEHLDALERGEMKHGSTGDSDEGENDDGDTEDQSDVEEEEEIEAEEIEIEQETEGDSFIINTPESMEDPEVEEVDMDFDMEVPEFYDDINVDSKEGYTLEFVQKDLLTLNDEDESVYISSPQPIQQQQQQKQHQLLSFQQIQSAPKRARLDVNYSISPASNATNGVGTIAVNGTNGVTTTTINQIHLGRQQFQFATSGHQQQQQQFQQIQQQQQHHNRRKTPLVTRLA
ncbi:uncharacterized protein LOC129761867 isoform X2 [Toxorhynchites rutilus septentrionalis]|nr:uncharacterized protein LOC129761867 isoform X2 [Toxorhynchites rutilus septentrionalis]